MVTITTERPEHGPAEDDVPIEKLARRQGVGPIRSLDEFARPDLWESEQESQAFGDIIATAAITAAVMPFVQTLATKVAEDTYAGVRTWLRGLFHSSKAKRVPAGHRNNKILIIIDPDPALNLALIVPTDLSDRAIKALDGLDLDEVVAKSKRGKVAQLRIYWDERTGMWKVDQ